MDAVVDVSGTIAGRALSENPDDSLPNYVYINDNGSNEVIVSDRVGLVDGSPTFAGYDVCAIAELQGAAPRVRPPAAGQEALSDRQRQPAGAIGNGPRKRQRPGAVQREVRMGSRGVGLSLVLLSLWAAGCSSYAAYVRTSPGPDIGARTGRWPTRSYVQRMLKLRSGLAEHVLPIGTDGKMATFYEPGRGVHRDPDGHPRCGEAPQPPPRHPHIERLVAAYAESGRELLIYVHGGLNSLTTSAQGAQAKLEQIDAHGSYHPIFVNWETGLWSSYGDHLTHPDDGDYRSSRGSLQWDVLNPPFALVMDTAEMAGGIPRSYAAGWKQLGASYLETCDATEAELMDGTPRCGQAPAGDGPHVCWRDAGACSTHLGMAGLAALQLVFKFVSTPVVHGYGGKAWRDMVRRARLIFRPDEEFCPRAHPEHAPGRGALARLLFELQKHCAGADGSGSCDVTVAGHSMGAMVLNDVLHDYEGNPHLRFHRIIYMGAAGNVRESLAALSGYLTTHDSARFYGLTLHPTAEAREASAAGFAPDGSLLVWIDSMYERPAAFVDRTFGAWANTKPALHTVPRHIRDRMHFKVFGMADEDPVDHGALDDGPFWTDDYLFGNGALPPEP